MGNLPASPAACCNNDLDGEGNGPTDPVLIKLGKQSAMAGGWDSNGLPVAVAEDDAYPDDEPWDLDTISTKRSPNLLLTRPIDDDTESEESGPPPLTFASQQFRSGTATPPTPKKSSPGGALAVQGASRSRMKKEAALRQMDLDELVDWLDHHGVSQKDVDACLSNQDEVVDRGMALKRAQRALAEQDGYRIQASPS